jgi:hypothetical protein
MLARVLREAAGMLQFRSAFVLCVAFASLAITRPAVAEIVVLDYEGGEPVDFTTDPYLEDGFRTDVEAGHYEILDDADPQCVGDRAFNVDEQVLGLTQVRLSAEDGSLFDVLTLDVVNPATQPGEVAISAVGGAGAVSAPTVAGPFAPGPGFQGISALVITQNAPGAFAMDDVTLNVMPEPAQAPSLVALSLVVFALRRRRSG